MVYNDGSRTGERAREGVRVSGVLREVPLPRRREEIGLLDGIRVSLIMLYRGLRETFKDRY